MNILVIGQNGREHALAVAYAKSKKVSKVIMTPGNGLTDFQNIKIKNYPKAGMTDFKGIVKVCKKEKIDLVDVAQDDVIAAGYVDRLEELGIAAFGPTKLASQLEWDKEWARNFMLKYNLPIPRFQVFNNQKKAISYINSLPEQVLFVKASGLALGKGVIRAENKKEAIEAVKAMKNFGGSGETFLIEEALVGEEFSLFAICDGENFQVTKAAQDHKRIYDGDKGPNTGGVGSIAPTGAVSSAIIREIESKIIKPTLLGMKNEGRVYKGILYLGGIITSNGVKVIEFNCRWGDPEAEVIVPSIQTDYLSLVDSVRVGRLSKSKIQFDEKIRLSVAGCSKGYPQNYSSVIDKEIFGLTDAMKLPDITIFGAGIKRSGKRFFANGGRVFHVVGEGKNVIETMENAYKAISMITIEGNNLYYRTDIGWRDLGRLKK
ncbi:phosphoribosylamine--glycine ligase [Candidatus Daviesbacteria bacterium]|nr:phosphoribosylamine--glycine ligase [Candidatus Daviesbacteria bacterium]